ncbi:hypothetical protein YC2023_027730 [Brassica napus]
MDNSVDCWIDWLARPAEPSKLWFRQPVAALKGSGRSIDVRSYDLSIFVRPYITLRISGAVVETLP